MHHYGSPGPDPPRENNGVRGGRGRVVPHYGPPNGKPVQFVPLTGAEEALSSNPHGAVTAGAAEASDPPRDARASAAASAAATLRAAPPEGKGR